MRKNKRETVLIRVFKYNRPLMRRKHNQMELSSSYSEKGRKPSNFSPRKRKRYGKVDHGDALRRPNSGIETSHCMDFSSNRKNDIDDSCNKHTFYENVTSEHSLNSESISSQYPSSQPDRSDPHIGNDRTRTRRSSNCPSVSGGAQTDLVNTITHCFHAPQDQSHLHKINTLRHDSPDEIKRWGCHSSFSLREYLIHILKSTTPTYAELNNRRFVIQSMKEALVQLGLTVKVYGSLITGLMINTSDIDMVMVPLEDANLQTLMPRSEKARNIVDIAMTCTCEYPTPMQKAKIVSCIRTVGSTLRYCKRNFSHIVSITRAKVPIVKCETTGIFSRVSVDLTFDKSGLATSAFLCKAFLKRGNELARGLTTLVKVLLASASLNDPSVGGLGSFPTAIMTLFFVEVYVKEHVPQELHQDLGVLLGSFLKFFGAEFDFQNYGIDYIGGKVFVKPPTNALFLTNPLCPGTNCASAATLFERRIRPYFRSAAATINPLISSNHEMEKIKENLLTLFSAASTHTLDERNNFSHSMNRKNFGSTSEFDRPQKANIWDDDGLYCGAFLDF